MTYSRYAIYYAPPETAGWTRFCTGWLGWDMLSGRPADHPEATGLPRPISEITATPRKYGLHGTLKPPFRLAEGTTAAGLEAACADLAATLAPFELAGLRLTRLGRFLCLQPSGPAEALAALAGACVQQLDRFRAPAGTAELARRRAAGLSPRQEDNLTRWGYPYVLEDFRFHITLSGRLPKDQIGAVESWLAPRLTPLLPDGFTVPDIALVGEASDGMFHLIRRFPLSG
ncbi:phosphonate metabolism protein [Pseudooceanicola lipolyticus]|uniref:Phosphonate metabolism protein n=1 Tax=Pseudooceanicola lipolyticus TaxID=2029104 RepID=A0A2M8IVA5_9RHOB|nr:DUF1045 domain-containing protein [Pseudooceanicola lipolyticus]PJE34466.1 phosphonate metabolism protein [Pseudooceanicola lipolyticus]